MNNEIYQRVILADKNINQMSIDESEVKKLEEDAMQVNIANIFALNRIIAAIEDKGIENLFSNNNQIEPLVDTVTMATHLGLRPLAVRKMAKAGEIPSLKVPPRSNRGKLLFKIREVEKALQNASITGRPRKRLI